MKRRVVCLGQTADMAGISVKTLRRRIADGTIPAYRRLAAADQRYEEFASGFVTYHPINPEG